MRAASDGGTFSIKFAIEVNGFMGIAPDSLEALSKSLRVPDSLPKLRDIARL
jgi:hypothetical protein